MRKYIVHYYIFDNDRALLALPFEMTKAQFPEIEMISAAYWAEKKIREHHSVDPTQCVPFHIVKLEIPNHKREKFQ